ncbi:MAG TPA: hypothetical protein VE404_04525 [Verrucomicrobiae bacterium]|nr:hypothetical protein [Verrucomicrobiae bacterium]
MERAGRFLVTGSMLLLALASSPGADVSPAAEQATQPEITALAAIPRILNSADGQLLPVSIGVDATSGDELAPACEITWVTANEPIVAPGDDVLRPDFILPDPGLTPSPARWIVLLRAHRSSAATERVYTVGVSCSDAAGNASRGVATVTVPLRPGRGSRGVEPDLAIPAPRE